MKKQYLIGLLGLAAISISFGNNFSVAKLSPSSVNNDQTNTNIDKYSNEYFNYSIEQVSAGAKHSGAVVNDGISDHLYTWGRNSDGQLGLGDVNQFQYNTPQEVTSLPEGEIEQISMGYDYSSAIVNDGTSDHLYTWGLNDNGQLGLGDKTNYNTPQEVKALPEGDIEQVSIGLKHSSAVVNDGTSDHLYTWGDNNDDQLGLGSNHTKSYYDTPQEVTDLPKGEIEDISMSNLHSAAIVNEKDGDHLYSWGRNSDGQLGLGDDYQELHYSTPQEVTLLPEGDIKEIATGDYYTGAVVNDGTSDSLYTWGLNYRGQLGLGYNFEEYSYNTPQEVAGLPEGDIEQISIGEEHTGAIINDGISDYLYTWGNNYNGQLGLGDDYYWWNYDYPKEVTLLPEGDIEQISLGDKYTVAVVNDGTSDYLYTWGLNEFGQLGVGSEQKDFNTPQEAAKMPYLNEINSSAIPATEDSEKVKIEYDFETNLNVQDVDVSIYETSAGADNEEIITSIPEYEEENKYEGQVEFDNIVPGIEYTYIISLNYLTPEGVLNSIDIDQDVFITDGSVDSTIKQNGEVTVTSSTEAILSYTVTPGKDENGDNVHVMEVKWMNGKQELATSMATSNVMTTDKLEPNQEYNDTTLIAEMSDGTFTNEVEVTDFQAQSGEVDSTIKQNGEVTVTSSTEAILSYTVTPGKDENGDNVDVIEVKWMNGSQELATSMATSNVMTTDQLVPYNTYNGTTLIATMSDGSIAETNVDEFQANSGEVASTISQDEEVVIIDNETASVDYKVTPGKEKNGKDVEVSNVKWMNGDTQLGVSKSNSNTGNIKANNLKLNENYSNTILVATMSDGTTAMTGIEPFKEAPLIQQPEEVNIDYEHDILEVSGEIDANDAEIKDIYFVDNNGKEIASEAVISEPNITKDNSENVSYDVWTSEYVEEEPSEGEPANLENYSLRVEYETSTGQDAVTTTTSEYSAKAEEQVVEDDLDYLYNGIDNNTNDETKLGGWSIFGIIIASSFMIGFIGYTIYYLFNKNKITKI